MLLRRYLAQGASESALARQFGISRDTIHRWIRAADPSPERISIARCRELLDEDADAMTDQRKIRCAK